MVPPEVAADLGQADPKLGAAAPHGELAEAGNVVRPAAANQFLLPDAELGAHLIDDDAAGVFCGDLCAVLGLELVELGNDEVGLARRPRLGLYRLGLDDRGWRQRAFRRRPQSRVNLAVMAQEVG